MKWILPVTIAILAVLANGPPRRATAQSSSTPPCRAGTLDLRAGVECEASLGFKSKCKGAKPEDVNSLTPCRRELNQGISYESNNQYQMAYDTLMAYVDTCYNDALSYEAFNTMSGSVDFLSVNNPNLWVQYRMWLESVLYLNTTNPEYFCQCVEAIAGTWSSPSDTTPALGSLATNKSLAVLAWLMKNTSCDTPYLWQQYEGGRNGQVQQWQLYNEDYPLDTTLPSLASLGLDTLLERHLLEIVPNQPVSIILNATASPNPVTTGTIITFGISQEAYVKINLFDILGNGVAGSGGVGYEGLFAPGNHEVPLPLQGLPSGTYFARILTAYGNVATVKLVKE
jgi:hypothetical protein